jgi:hypothetical protein
VLVMGSIFRRWFGVRSAFYLIYCSRILNHAAIY